MIRWILGIGALALIWWGLRMQDIDNLARTIWGEARGEGREGMQAVSNVVMNRVRAGRWFSGTVSAVVRMPYQFSVWNEGDPNRKIIEAANENTGGFLDAVELAVRAIRGDLPDITGGATHYHTIDITPPWADPAKVSARIGRHIFYKGVA